MTPEFFDVAMTASNSKALNTQISAAKRDVCTSEPQLLPGPIIILAPVYMHVRRVPLQHLTLNEVVLSCTNDEVESVSCFSST